MDLPDLSEIKKRRVVLGLKQMELASSAGVSQSLIAKIESGTTDPSYSNVIKILRALEKKPTKIILARDVMSKKVIKAYANDSIDSVVRKIKRHDISQMPIEEEGRIIGCITESGIGNAISEKGGEKVKRMKIKELLEAPLPSTSDSAPLNIISSMLKSASAVLIMEKGRIKGIVTKADLLKIL